MAKELTLEERIALEPPPGMLPSGELYEPQVYNVEEATKDEDWELEELREAKDARDAMQPRSLYVRRDVLNRDEIVAWAKGQGIDVETPDELHVTVLYSRQPVDWIAMGEPYDAELEVKEGGPRAVEVFQPQGVLVLLFASTSLQWRHEDMCRRGGSHDYPDYCPHVTLSYGYELGVDSVAKAFEPYRGRILLGPEIFEEIESENGDAY